jgi:hypothetical protein
MSAITVESGAIKIPLESVAGDGWVVLTLAPNAYLILPTESLANYPRERLLEIGQAIRAITGPPEISSRYHPTKARALRELRALGYPVSGGEEYFPSIPENPPSLEQVRQELSSIQGSLADDVIAERDER